jgi:hypothetical protein
MNKNKKRIAEEVMEKIETLINDPEEQKKNEEFVRKVSYLSPEDLMETFNI